MAAVIRVKRRRNEDPAEPLILSQKKSRLDLAAAASDDKIDSVLEFAGTLSSKNEPVATHIREAIKKKKQHRQLHPHSTESKSASDLVDKVRTQNSQISQNNRYHIICSKRALDIDSLDKDGVNALHDADEKTEPNTSHTIGEVGDCDTKNSLTTKDSAASKKPPDLSSSSNEVLVTVQREEVDSSANSSSDARTANGSEVDSSSANKSNEISDKMFCLLDVEHQAEQGAQASASGITVNNVPMVSEKTEVPVEEESDDYVYDLYYAHTQLSESHLEAVLTVEAMCNELVYVDGEPSDEEEFGDLDEDSNDEGNWRNDYPNEDPGFYDNEGRDYDFENDMVERNFGGSDDEGDMLAYWMDTRCRIEVDCADFTNEGDDKTDDSSTDEYKEDEDYRY